MESASAAQRSTSKRKGASKGDVAKKPCLKPASEVSSQAESKPAVELEESGSEPKRAGPPSVSATSARAPAASVWAGAPSPSPSPAPVPSSSRSSAGAKPRVGGLRWHLAEASRQLAEVQLESTKTFLELKRCERSLSVTTRRWAEALGRGVGPGCD